MSKLRCILVLVLVVLIAAACGDGDDKKKDSDSPGGQSATTPEPTGLYPPTWTPGATLTQPPRVTIDYTYQAPTIVIHTPAPLVLPTRPPFTPAPPQTAAPPAKVTLNITAQMLNDLLGLQLGVLTSYFKTPPTTSFANGLVQVAATIYTTPSDTATARPILIEAGATLETSSIRLNIQRMIFSDDNSPYENELSGYILSTLETAVNDLVQQLYFEQYSGAYTITGVTVTDNGIAVEVTPRA